MQKSYPSITICYRSIKLYSQQGVQASNGGEENLCGGMFCEEPSNPSVCTTMLPQEYTTCGTGKVGLLSLSINKSATLKRSSLGGEYIKFSSSSHIKKKQRNRNKQINKKNRRRQV